MSAIHWFEIPVADMTRAAEFYGTLLDTEIRIMDLREQMGSLMGALPDRGGPGGALVQNEAQGYVPGMTGSMVYLVVDGALEEATSRAADAGGQVLLPKTPLGENQGGGFVAMIVDCEGNRVGLYSQS